MRKILAIRNEIKRGSENNFVEFPFTLHLTSNREPGHKTTLMKHIISLIALLMMTLPAFSQDGTKAQDEKATIVIKTKIYCDHCIQCEDCNANIINKVRSTNKGIKKVKVDPEQQTITVQYLPGKTDADRIRKAINAAGFDADDSPAPAEAVAKLDGCCRKK